MNKYWIPGPITNYGTTDAGFAGEVRVVKAADYDALAARLAEAERLLRESAPFASLKLCTEIVAFLSATDSAEPRETVAP